MLFNTAVSDLEYPEYAQPGEPADSSADFSYDFSLSVNPVGWKTAAAHRFGHRHDHPPGNEDFSEYRFSQDEKLLDAISGSIGITADNILITSGCDGALRHAAEIFLDPGDPVLIPCPSFGRYEFHAKLRSSRPVISEFSVFPHSLEISSLLGLLGKVKPKLLYYANPNNPTGELIGLSDVEELVEAAGSTGTAVLLDEALIDYCCPESSAARLIGTYPNLMVARSFSKLYALAGMRIGYIAAGPDIMGSLRKVVSPFEVSSPAITAAADVLMDTVHIEASRTCAAAGLDYLRRNLPRSICMSPSSTLVVLLTGTGEPGSLFSSLRRRGVITTDGRSFRGLELTDSVRICVKCPEAMQPLIDALKTF